MGVDIYVGTLTRYYARDWKTIVQQTMPTNIVYQGKNAPSDEPMGQAETQPLVLEWRAQLARHEGTHSGRMGLGSWIGRKR